MPLCAAADAYANSPASAHRGALTGTEDTQGGSMAADAGADAGVDAGADAGADDFVGIRLGIKPGVDVQLELEAAARGTDPDAELRRFVITGPPPLMEHFRTTHRRLGADALRGEMSPRSLVTIPMAKRRDAGVPPDAMYFTFAYPHGCVQEAFDALSQVHTQGSGRAWRPATLNPTAPPCRDAQPP